MRSTSRWALPLIQVPTEALEEEALVRFAESDASTFEVKVAKR